MYKAIFDPRSSIVKNVFDCHLSGVSIYYSAQCTGGVYYSWAAIQGGKCYFL